MSSEVNAPPAHDTLSNSVESLDELNKKTKEKPPQEQNQLEAEIFAIQSTNPPVKRLPAKLLSRVFEEYVIPETECKSAYEDANYDVVQIMLVCKSWRNIAINTCTLWSHISLSVPRKGSLETQSKSIKIQHHYLDLYLARSRYTLLNVIIDLQDMCCGIDIADDAMNHEPEDIVELGDRMEDWPAHFLAIPWTARPTRASFRSLSNSLLKKCFGSDGQHIVRWSNLKIWLPQDRKIASYLWTFLHHSAPQLKTLSVFGLEPYPNRQHQVSNSLAALSKLVLRRSHYLHAFPRCPSLRRLDLSMGLDNYKTIPFHFIGSFPLLEELCFTCDEDRVDDPFPYPVLDLPSLKVLELHEMLSQSFIQALRIENLNKLVIWQTQATVDTIPIADVCRAAMSIKWNYHLKGDPIFDVLLKLFSQPLQVTVIEVPHHVEEMAKEVITQCRSSGRLQSLKSVISFKQIYEDEELIKVDQTLLMTL